MTETVFLIVTAVVGGLLVLGAALAAVRERAASRLAGESFDAALKAAVEFKSRNIGALLTLLGENVTDLEDANRVVQHYEEVLAASGGVQAEISACETRRRYMQRRNSRAVP